MHLEGLHMSVWNQHDDFLAEEVAALAITDASESEGLLSLMHKAYDLALRETETKYLFITDKIEIDGEPALQSYRFKEDPLPEDGLYSVALEAYKDLLFDSLAVEQYGEQSLADVQKLFDTFRNEKHGEHPSLSSQFEIQKFSRGEIARWLDHKNVTSKYSFSPGTTKQPQEDVNREVKTNDRKGWVDIVGAYVIELQRSRRYGKAKDLFKALEASAKAGHGPFEIGEGNQRGSLIVKASGKSVALKTLANRWAEIQQQARKAP